MNTVWIIFYKDKILKSKKDYPWSIYDICSSEEVANKRLKEIQLEESDKIFKIEEWNVRNGE